MGSVVSLADKDCCLPSVQRARENRTWPRLIDRRTWHTPLASVPRRCDPSGRAFEGDSIRRREWCSHHLASRWSYLSSKNAASDSAHTETTPEDATTVPPADTDTIWPIINPSFPSFSFLPSLWKNVERALGQTACIVLFTVPVAPHGGQV